MITIEESKKILGPDYDDIPDKEIEKINELLSAICHLVINDYMKDPEWFLKKQPSKVEKTSKKIQKKII